MSKFVKHNVLTVGWISCTVFDGTPGQNQRSHSMSGLPEATYSAFFPKMLSNLSLFVRRVRQRINENREQLWEIIRCAMQQQKTSLGGDSHTDLVGDGETAASLETLFGKEHLNVTKQFQAIARR